ncbi:MAG: 50S ribosomal protein L11 methyltransferase [Vallitaleaceae bacterium]|nr:50S ribosomal protein L11 methyltransferase [Vallitaleaceae bacterium]
MKYRELTIYIQRDAVDVVCAMLYDYPIQGVEIMDQFLSQEEQDEMFVDAIEFDNVMAEEVGVKFYLSYEEDLTQILESIDQRLDELAECMDLGSRRLTTEDSFEEDWANNWKQYYKPFFIGSDILIKPLWETLDEESKKKARIIIDMDPGMAFGSGTHETTSLCIRALDRYLKPTDTFIDVGCGSGILGIVAAKLGANKGILIDLDKNAVKVAKENIEINQVASNLEVLHGDLLQNIHEEVDLVVANIFAEVIMGVSPDVHKILKPEGLFIASGIIHEKAQLVCDKLEADSFEVLEVVKDGGWVVIISKKRS